MNMIGFVTLGYVDEKQVTGSSDKNINNNVFCSLLGYLCF